MGLFVPTVRQHHATVSMCQWRLLILLLPECKQREREQDERKEEDTWGTVYDVLIYSTSDVFIQLYPYY